MGIHVKLARMTDGFWRELIPCRNGRGYTSRLNCNCIFRFPNGLIEAGKPVVVDICFEKAEKRTEEDGIHYHRKPTFVIYLRKPTRCLDYPPRYDLELQFRGKIPEKNLPREKWTPKRVRFCHTLNPFFRENGKPFPLLVLRENEYHRHPQAVDCGRN